MWKEIAKNIIELNQKLGRPLAKTIRNKHGEAGVKALEKKYVKWPSPEVNKES